jgi:hypothetical protein
MRRALLQSLPIISSRKEYKDVMTYLCLAAGGYMVISPWTPRSQFQGNIHKRTKRI